MSGNRKKNWSVAAAVALAASTALALVPSASAASPAAPAPQAPAAGAAALEGVWQGVGYQRYVAVHRGVLRSYEYSAAGCLPGRWQLSAGRAGGGAVTGVPFRDADSVRQLSMRATPDGRGARLTPAGSVGEQRLRRVAELPADCTRKPSGDPVHTFDTFWSTLRENYPFLRAKGIDWDAARERYRPQVHPGTTDDELFRILSAMIEPLHDMHTQLADGTGKRRTLNLRPGTPFPTEKYLADVEAATRAQLPEKVHSFANGKIQYADLKQGTGPGQHLGYLRITGFIAFADGDRLDADADAAALDRALDAVLTEQRTRSLRGLVVDLRFNGGGADALGTRIAARLTDRTYTAYTKSARNDPQRPDSWTPGQPIRVHPAPGPRYTGPLAVLTGPLTISAGESFTQSLMGRSPAPVRIGESTQGVFSDTMDRVLPNGWTLTVPNEKYADARGRTYDGTGIPPTHRVPVYAPADLAALRDPALTRAVRELGAR
ncbi:S41 family peptidase [Streptomyces sp. NPDC004111]|uniref:S41 family peptidase n=1 Tax=Streptomyces sp. NPDC004111 TaxID=3364690 RepID=UPI00369D203B